MKNKIEDLRDHLFATIEGLLDPDNPLALDRAKTVAEVAAVLVNSAKVEVDYLRATDNVRGSGFFPEDMKTIPGETQPRIGRAGKA